VEKRKKKEHKKRKKGEERKKKREQNATVKSKKTQRQGRELNQHSTFSSPSPSSSPQRASAEGKKRNREPAWPSFSVSPEAVTTGCAQKLQYRFFIHLSYQRGRERKHRRRDRGGKKKGESAGKTKNHKPAGTAFRSLLSFFAYKICRTGKEESAENQ
jgi:hypothetical protein